ncbi:MAG TPA: hypothetical protein QF753_04345 [Victivallales bacterium]|nr:hypothetical protein [Victivallales bacterium]
MLKLLAIFLIVLFSLEIFAVDITTLDGKTYKNAEVIKKMQNGIIISYTDNDGFNDVLHVDFKNLPEKIRSKYGYNSGEYNNYTKQHNKWMNTQYQKAKEAEVQSEKQQQYLKKLGIETERITSLLEAKKIKIMFSALTPQNDGTVGWARVISSMGTEFQSLGRIYLIGLIISSKTKWSGYVYPVSMTKKIDIGVSDQSNDGGAEFLPDEKSVDPTKVHKSVPNEGEIVVPCYATYKTALKMALEKDQLNSNKSITK